MKKLSVILSIVFVLCFCFTGCNDEVSDTSIVAEQPATNTNGVFGEYEVSVESARFIKDYDGKDCVVITYNFTNNSSVPICFLNAFSCTVFQNDIGLTEPYCFNGEPYDLDSPWVDIKNGATLEVEVGYILNDLESDLEVEISEFYSNSINVYTKTIHLTEVN